MMVHEIAGDVISSTRTEIVGAMVALLRPRAMYINSDSMAMLSRAMAITSRAWNHFRAKPWALVKDGDL